MKKRRWMARPAKVRQHITDEVAATLRSFIANTWLVIGNIRKKRIQDARSGYSPNEKPWNPCLRAQQNYVAWCQKHKVSPQCWDNFVYYFGLRNLFLPLGLPWPMMPEKLSIATMELEIASGSNWSSYSYFNKETQESLPSYEDRWDVMLTARGAPSGDDEEEFRLKKKLIIQATSFTSDGKPSYPRWEVSYRVPRIWSTPRFTSRVVIDFQDQLRSTKDTFGQWWVPVLASLGHPISIPKLQVQVQPLTHRYQHEIDGNRWGEPRYEE